jgi:hypothetical protein
MTNRTTPTPVLLARARLAFMRHELHNPADWSTFCALWAEVTRRRLAGGCEVCGYPRDGQCTCGDNDSAVLVNEYEEGARGDA